MLLSAISIRPLAAITPTVTLYTIRSVCQWVCLSVFEGFLLSKKESIFSSFCLKQPFFATNTKQLEKNVSNCRRNANLCRLFANFPLLFVWHFGAFLSDNAYSNYSCCFLAFAFALLCFVESLPSTDFSIQTFTLAIYEMSTFRNKTAEIVKWNGVLMQNTFQSWIEFHPFFASRRQTLKQNRTEQKAESCSTFHCIQSRARRLRLGK